MKVPDNNKQSVGLEMKHFVSYFPYGLRFAFTKDYYFPYPEMQKKGFSFTFDLLETPKILYRGHVNKSWIGVILEQVYFKPILRLLSDAEIRLVKYEFLQLGLDTVFNWKNILLILRKGQFSLLPQSLFDVLLRLHVDVFGLIEQGLAIDINTLEP